MKNKKAKIELNDIFKESAMKVIKDSSSLSVEVDSYPDSTELINKKDSITESNIDIKLNNNTKDKKDQWEKLKEMIDGQLTEKFTTELIALPPREYIRVYLKLIEFFKPKITRQISDGNNEVDNEIHIHVHDTNKEEKSFSHSVGKTG